MSRLLPQVGYSIIIYTIMKVGIWCHWPRIGEAIVGFSLLDHEHGYCILTPSSQEYIQYIYIT